jgi:hypothetical protein
VGFLDRNLVVFFRNDGSEHQLPADFHAPRFEANLHKPSTPQDYYAPLFEHSTATEPTSFEDFHAPQFGHYQSNTERKFDDSVPTERFEDYGVPAYSPEIHMPDVRPSYERYVFSRLD